MSQAPQPAPSRWPALTLRPSDQFVAATILAAALAVLGFYWTYQQFFGRGLIDIDRAPPREILFLVDVNEADWPEPTRRHFEKMSSRLVFSAKDLPKRSFYDHRDSPGVDRAAEAIKALLANGPATCNRIFAAGTKAGVSRSSLYKAAKRLAVTQKGGTWSFAEAAKSA